MVKEEREYDLVRGERVTGVKTKEKPGHGPDFATNDSHQAIPTFPRIKLIDNTL